ncbi:YrhC family protein [Alteribacillus sp. HJP-4]|uniref:YrhC family protein n=1 Tax=Alteribacillus sp. HJP-4 TaxID=2775394 RepID=UPI0035CD16A1
MDKQEVKLMNKVKDFIMFSRVIFSLATFLFLGLILPESNLEGHLEEGILLISILLIISISFHSYAMKVKQSITT